jgi:fructose-bisphosphate aldolase class II
VVQNGFFNMKYEQFGLVNTKEMFLDANRNRYAIGAFNFYNMESLTAILAAARTTSSPIILAVSESALNYMGDEMLMAMIAGARIATNEQIALHLDHGHSYDACVHAIDIGFSSVMIDASNMSFDDNIKISARVAEYAHKHNASIEAELGALRGFEDENTNSDSEFFTDPHQAVEFVSRTNIDSLAVAIGTSHGAYKRKNDSETLRFDILEQIEKFMPQLPIVLHGASCIPDVLLDTINNNGGKIENASGISIAQLRRAAQMNVCKINVDSDNRLAFTAAIRETLNQDKKIFNPREYLDAAKSAVYENTVGEIINIMNSANRLK